MATHPNGVWIWVLSEIRSDYLEKLVEQKVKRVYLKVFDGRSNPMFWGFQCSPQLIQQLKTRNIEVYGWGYHYGTADVDAQISAVKQALDCGLDGYILDVEEEVKDSSTHPYLRKLLEGLRPLLALGKLGYTSFGHPGFHAEMPWQMLDELCDLALPQIYFEKFRFGSTNEDEVQACLKAHSDLGLTKPILPIWGSESDTVEPAKAGELQSYLNRFSGSSIWRIPSANALGEAWKLNYSSEPAQPSETNLSNVQLPKLTRILKRGSIGVDVAALQNILNALGFNAGGADSEFGSKTEAAVRRFQKKAGITVDGAVGSETWKALGGEVAIQRNPLELLGDFAEQEATKSLSWTGSTSEAEEYLELFREPMLKLGQIGTAKVFYDWCGAFVYFCCQKTGVQVPIQPQGWWATMALVESWQYWAQKNSYWYPKGTLTPKRGDILVFDWDGDGVLNHIGIVRGYTPGSNTIQTSEGNKGNLSGNFTRSMSDVAGFIRIA